MRCTFCAKSQHDVTLLIAGPGAAICNECVALCEDLVDDSEVERRLRDVDADDDPVATLGAYLADYAPEQLAAYVARAQKRVADARQAIAGLDGGEESLPIWLLGRDAPDRATVRARLARQVAMWTRSADVVARVLAGRS